MPQFDSEDAVIDFDAYLGRQPADVREAWQSDLAPLGEPERAAEKQKTADIFRVADVERLNPLEAEQNWNAVRGGYAEKRGGKWLEAKDDPAKFHGLLVEEATQLRDERFLIRGLDNASDPKAPDAWKSSLLFQAQEAAYNGKSYADALTAWEQSARGKSGYDDARSAMYAEAAAEAHQGTSVMLAKVKPIAAKAVDAIALSRAGEGGDAAPFALFRGLSDAEKQLAFRVMTDEAGAGQIDGKSRGLAFDEAIGRGFENLAIGGGAAAWRDRLLRSSFKAGDLVAKGDAASEVKADYIRESVARMGANTGGGPNVKTRALTAEEAKQWNADLATAVEDLDTSEALRKFGQQVVDPAKAGGTLFQKLVLPVADSTAVMTSLAIPGAWAPALELGARSYQNDAYQQFRDEGMDAREASKLALVTGAAQSALDKLQFSVLAKGIPATNRALQQFAMRGSVGARFAANAGGTLAAETVIELTQDHVIPALVQDSLTSDPQFDVRWADVWREAAAAAPDVALGMVLLSGLGGVAQTRSQSAYVRELSGSRAALRLSGYSNDAIRAIQSAPIEERGALLAEYLPQSAPLGAEKEALISEAVTYAREEAKTFAKKHAAETTAATEAANYAIRVTRSGSGWWVTQGEDVAVRVSTAEAAIRIRDDLKQAATAAEAEGFVALIDEWHAKTPEGAKRETQVTGDTVRSDGEAVTREREGEVEIQKMTPEALDTLREEARMDAKSSGNTEIDVAINGSNEVFREKVTDGAGQLVQRLEINRGESAVLTFLHESVEADWRAGIASGAISREATQRAIAALAPGLDPAQARDAEEKSFRERVQRVASGAASETELRETLSELAVADAIGRRRDGSAMPAGAITSALDAAIRDQVKPSAIREIGKLRAFLRAVRQYFRAIFGTVAALKKSRKEGKAVEFDALIAKLTGHEQTAHDAAVVDEVADYVPPTAEEEAEGVAFSIKKSTGKATESDIQRALREDVLDYLKYYVDAANKTESSDDYSRLENAGNNAHERAMKLGLSESDATQMLSDVQMGASVASVFEEFSPKLPGAAFRVSAGARLEAMQNRLDAALARDPEARRRIGRRASERLQRLQFDWETLRQTWRGDAINPLVEKRSAIELEKEQAMRQALRTEELTAAGMAALKPEVLQALDFGAQKFAEGFLGSTILAEAGRLMSKTEAAKRGLDNAQEYDGVPWLPAEMWGGTMRPDETAQILADMGLIPDGYPQTLWDALGKEMASIAAINEGFKKARKTVTEIERQARNQAREEAAEWRREQDEMQKEDWSPRARLVRDLRALDAILSALPAEIRGKVGGFVKLAKLGSDQARLEEIGRRIERMSKLLEKHLQSEFTESLDALLEKAAPDREAGKASRGKLGAETHRYFDEIARVRGMSPAEVDAERAKIEAGYASPTLTNEQAANLFELEQILDSFGAWDKKTAADMDAAMQRAEKVYQDARNYWREKEQARLAEVQSFADAVVETLGGSSDTRIAAQKSPGLAQKLRGVQLDLKSFAEVLDALLGREHPLARRWAGMARDGLNAKNDEVRALRKRWKSAMEAATRKRGVEAMRALWNMGQKRDVTVENAGVANVGTLDVPISVIDSWGAGSDPSALGISTDEADQLTSLRAAMTPDDRRQSLSIRRESRALGTPVVLTEAEAIFLSMLGAQEQYHEGLDRAGYTAEVLLKLEDQISNAGKKLREFMRNEYRDGYAPLASVFENMFGVALPQIRNYAPAAFYHEGIERAMDPTGSGAIEGGFRAGFLKNRKEHVAAPRLENAFATFFGHVNQTAHWKHMAEFVREFSGVLNKSEVKRAIESAHGKDMLDAVNDWRRALEGNGLQQESGRINKLVRWITAAQVHIALAWNIGTIFKQSSALLGSAYSMPLGEYAKGFAKLMSGQLDARAMFNSPAIQRRLESGFAPEVRAAMNDIWSAKPTAARALVEKGTEFIGLVDAFFTTGSAAIAYDYHHRSAQEAGLTGAAAHEAAMREVEEIVARTAQPSDVADRSLFELQLNSWGRLAFMFASEARQKSSLTFNAWVNTLSGNATKADLRVLLISHLIVGPMIQAITAGWRDARDDDDDELFDAEHWKPADFVKAIVAGPLAGIPLLGDLVSGFQNDGILSRFKNAFFTAGNLFDGPSEREAEPAEWYAKRIALIMQGMSAEIGVAGRVAGQAFSVADNLGDTESEAAKKERAAQRREAREE